MDKLLRQLAESKAQHEAEMATQAEARETFEGSASDFAGVAVAAAKALEPEFPAWVWASEEFWHAIEDAFYDEEHPETFAEQWVTACVPQHMAHMAAC